MVLLFFVIIISIHTVSQTDHREGMNRGKPGPFLTSQILTPAKKTQQLGSASLVRLTRALGPFAAPILFMPMFLGTNLFTRLFIQQTCTNS